MNGDAAQLRTLLLVVLLFAITANAAELLLLEHFEDRVQYLPLAALAIGFICTGLALRRATRKSIAWLRLASALLMVVGLAGFYFHYRGNAEFELEMYPTVGGFELFWNSLQGATPALAPGVMILFGLLGFVSTVKHPALETERTP